MLGVAEAALSVTPAHAAWTRALGAGGAEEEEAEHVEPVVALLFPWFAQMLGVIVLFLLSRFVHQLPYTAVLFVIGTLMGVGLELSGTAHTVLGESAEVWIGIDSEVLLVGFLPGLLFGDALHLNYHLFERAFGQILVLAFPAVLVGTMLTACVGYFVFPFGWPFELALTFGAILSATDPVAVTALLKEVGAPPRLQMLITGESMFNDGSALVFFLIFGELYLNTLGEGSGEAISVGEGFAQFFRNALGGALIGLAFGIMLILTLFMLDRKLSAQDTILQISATITCAYLSYFVAEILAGTSGILAVVVCGIVTSAFGRAFIHQPETLESVWGMIEHLLNTLLFFLGGVLWGSVISNIEERNGFFLSIEYGYLIVLFILLTAIRFLVVFLSFPLLRRIGLGVNWREAVFMSWGGVRGAVGIALAISLDADVFSATESGDPAREHVSEAFGMIGGIALLTLVINGTTAGPILKRLGLAESSQARLQVVEALSRSIRRRALDELLDAVSVERFRHVDFRVVDHHVSLLKDLNSDDVRRAVARFRGRVPIGRRVAVDFDAFFSPVIFQETKDDTEVAVTSPGADSTDLELGDAVSAPDRAGSIAGAGSETWSGSSRRDDACAKNTSKVPASLRHRLASAVESTRRIGNRAQAAENLDVSTQQRAMELREIFVDILRREYWLQVDDGELGQRGYLVYTLLQSLDISLDTIAEGEPLRDWEASKQVSNSFISWVDALVYAFRVLGFRNLRADLDYHNRALRTLQAITFIHAHQEAQRKFRAQFVGESDELSEAERIVLNESKAQSDEVRAVLDATPEALRRSVVSHAVSSRVLIQSGRNVTELVEKGLLKEREAQVFLDSIAKDMKHVSRCSVRMHDSLRDPLPPQNQRPAGQKAASKGGDANDRSTSLGGQD